MRAYARTHRIDKVQNCVPGILNESKFSNIIHKNRIQFTVLSFKFGELTHLFFFLFFKREVIGEGNEGCIYCGN